MTGADRILRIAPRLAKVSVHVAISYGLHAGANKALLASRTSNYAKRQIVEAYRAEAAMMTVVRLCALLDRGDKSVSYQRVYDLLKLPDVVEDLVARVKRATVEFFSEQVESKSRQGIADFGQAYAAIFNSTPGLHGRLVHFRNYGVAHLSETELTKHITYDELGFLVGKVMEMTNALRKFAPNEVVFHGDEAEEYATSAEQLMMTALDADSAK